MASREELEKRAVTIASKCIDAMCSEEKRKKHMELFVKTLWDMHPPKGFRDWWTPWGKDEQSGADKGGHPDAYRTWARSEENGSYSFGKYGIETIIAWNTAIFRDEYLEWLSLGSPLRKDVISIAASLQRQRQFWNDLKPILNKVDKPMRT